MMPAIPVEWPICVEMIQKLPMSVSHIHIVVNYSQLANGPTRRRQPTDV